MPSLIQHLQSTYILSDAALDAIHEQCEQITLAKGSFLLKESGISRHLHFVELGALRGYYQMDGKEITHWFAFENDFVTSFHSYITGEPSVENIQAMEGCVLWRIEKQQLTDMCNRFHEIERLVRLVHEQYYIRLEERFVNAQFASARQRYDQLLHRTPHILERMPLGCIAAYLGISAETLSRIRHQH